MRRRVGTVSRQLANLARTKILSQAKFPRKADGKHSMSSQVRARRGRPFGRIHNGRGAGLSIETGDDHRALAARRTVGYRGTADGEGTSGRAWKVVRDRQPR